MRPCRPSSRGWSSTSIMASARAIMSTLPLSSRALRSGSSRIFRSWRSNACCSHPLTWGPRTTLRGTSWKMTRWLAGTSGRVRPLTNRGTSREAISWLGAKLTMPSSSSRTSTPYSRSTRRAVAKSRRGGSGSVSLRVTRSAFSRRPGEMTKDMPSSSPKTSLMKGTSGTSWKLTRMGSPVRSSPRRSAMPSATVRWMTTPGVRVVRGPVRVSSAGEGASSRAVVVAGSGFGGRRGSGNGSTSTVEQPVARHAASRVATRRRRSEFIDSVDACTGQTVNLLGQQVTEARSARRAVARCAAGSRPGPCTPAPLPFPPRLNVR